VRLTRLIDSVTHPAAAVAGGETEGGADGVGDADDRDDAGDHVIDAGDPVIDAGGRSVPGKAD
jgi:hypothetical protein